MGTNADGQMDGQSYRLTPGAAMAAKSTPRKQDEGQSSYILLFYLYWHNYIIIYLWVYKYKMNEYLSNNYDNLLYLNGTRQ